MRGSSRKLKAKEAVERAKDAFASKYVSDLWRQVFFFGHPAHARVWQGAEDDEDDVVGLQQQLVAEHETGFVVEDDGAVFNFEFGHDDGGGEDEDEVSKRWRVDRSG